ncbi:MAG: 30S ribosomal protein S9 [bacterium]
MVQTTTGATGRRKSAVARAELKQGSGVFTVNGKSLDDYLLRATLVSHAREPLDVAEAAGTLDVRCSARGGGVAGQAGAIRLAVARALLRINPELRAELRKQGMLTRDAREVERKKYGQPKARKRFQFSKR